MADYPLSTPGVTFGDINFSGGLNTAAGPLSLNDTESPDLQNIDFNKFGSVLKRSGYAKLNASAIATSPNSDGLHWYEFVSSGATVRKLINVAGAKIFKMDDLDGTWDDITGSVTITADNFCDFENFLNELYVTNGTDVPFKWTGSGNVAAMTVPTDLTDAKYVKQFNNYLFLANVIVNSVTHKSRIYWSNIRDTGTWTATDFIDIAKNDGQEITGIRVLNDRLVIFKERSIYNLFFTGDPDVPFILPGGGKSNSSVGCIAPFSIQEAENGIFFLSYDGFYFYDGNNSYKLSDKITPTIISFNMQNFRSCRSLVQRQKNKYWCSLPSSGQTTNDRVLVFDMYLKSWTLWTGLGCAAMCTVYIDGIEERPYFGDYAGFVYRADFGDNDNPLGVETAINSYYYTNWRHFKDLINKKGVPQAVIYFQTSESVLSFSYTYDFQTGDQYTSTFSLSGGGAAYGTAIYDTDVYASDGGGIKRRDLTGRGRLWRGKFANSTIDETFQIDGLGLMAAADTNV